MTKPEQEERLQAVFDALTELRDRLASDEAVPTGELLDESVEKLNAITDKLEAAALRLAGAPQERTYEAWIASLPMCVGFEGRCDGDLPGEEHADHCPMKGKKRATLRDAWNATRAAASGTQQGELREALVCAEYALSHPESDQAFALNAVHAALHSARPEVGE